MKDAKPGSFRGRPDIMSCRLSSSSMSLEKPPVNCCRGVRDGLALLRKVKGCVVHMLNPCCETESPTLRSLSPDPLPLLTPTCSILVPISAVTSWAQLARHCSIASLQYSYTCMQGECWWEKFPLNCSGRGPWMARPSWVNGNRIFH